MVADERLNTVVIEDNPDLNDMLVEDLRSAGYKATGYRSVEAFEAAASPADVVLLDVNLPGKNGLEFARILRATDKRVGIVVLSVRTGADNRTIGYQNGVDIYLQKPCGSVELVAAIHRVAARVRMHGGLPLDGRRACRLLVGRRSLLSGPDFVALSQRETDLLAALARTSERQLSYETCKRFFARDGDIQQSALEVAVGRLRKKIEQISGVPRAILSVRGTGYRLVIDISVQD